VAAAAAVGGLVLVTRPDSPSTRPAPARSGERPFRACKLEGKPRAVIATIHAREPVPHLPTIASWFPPDVPPHEIEIRGVTSGDKRMIAFELREASWSAWRAVVGDATGEEICWRLGAWLRERGAGREEDARPDVLGDRGPEAREEALGTVAALSAPGAHRRLESWLNPSGLRASCEVERTRFDLVARCTVESVSDSEQAIALTATLEVDDQPPLDQTRGDVIVGAGESIVVPFHFDVPGAFEAASCRCQARAR
jgi:hypothetical protein